MIFEFIAASFALAVEKEDYIISYHFTEAGHTGAHHMYSLRRSQKGYVQDLIHLRAKPWSVEQ